MGNEDGKSAEFRDQEDVQPFEDKLRAGDDSVLSEILNQHGGQIAGAIRRHTGLSKEDVEDVLVDALYKLWTLRKQYDPKRSSISAWFYVIARSLALKISRSHRNSREVNMQSWDNIPASPKAPAPTPEVLDAVNRVCAGLSEQDKLIVQADKNHPTWAKIVAEQCGIPPGRVRVRWNRLKKKMMQQ